jgi:hypothetical protein
MIVDEGEKGYRCTKCDINGCIIDLRDKCEHCGAFLHWIVECPQCNDKEQFVRLGSSK